jgi:hypothetical protein
MAKKVSAGLQVKRKLKNACTVGGLEIETCTGITVSELPPYEDIAL